MNARQQRFVSEYLRDFNAAAAYRRAGYRARGNAAIVNACRLLTKPEIAFACARAKAEQSRRIALRQDRVVAELAALAFSRLSDFAGWDGDGLTLKPSAAVDGRPILTVTQTERVIRSLGHGTVLMSRERSITLHNKLTALQLLGQPLGLFPERHERRQRMTSEPVQVEIRAIDYRQELASP